MPTPERQLTLAKNPPGDFRKRYQVTCCKCGIIATVSSNKDSSLPFVVLERKFAERGWSIGSNADHDLCPDHASRHHAKKPQAVDPEQPLITRIDQGIQVLERSLGEFLQLEHPQHQQKVMEMLDGFRARVFGNGASS